MRCNSGHRCRRYNSVIGGAPQSAHLYLAGDVSTRGRDPRTVLAALRAAGFSSFGFYRTFIHADLRPGRSWYGSAAARQFWERLRASSRADVIL